MTWVFAIVIVLTIGGIAVVALGGGDSLAVVYDDRPDAVVPAEGPLRAEDLAQLRFSTAFRGYRASEVDALLDRLAAQLAEAPEPPERPESSGEVEPAEPADPAD